MAETCDFISKPSQATLLAPKRRSDTRASPIQEFSTIYRSFFNNLQAETRNYSILNTIPPFGADNFKIPPKGEAPPDEVFEIALSHLTTRLLTPYH
jgi:hypothetical protein